MDSNRCFSLLLQIYGTNYLHNLLEPLIKPLLTNPIPYEVDPARLDDTENIEANRKNLIALTSKVFEAIVDSAEIFPPQLRSMCHCLYQVRLSRIILSFGRKIQ